MPDDIPSISDIVNQLPSKLQHRFLSLGSYVQAIIDEESSKGAYYFSPQSKRRGIGS